MAGRDDKAEDYRDWISPSLHSRSLIAGRLPSEQLFSVKEERVLHDRRLSMSDRLMFCRPPRAR
jgi:hypothetical protein